MNHLETMTYLETRGICRGDRVGVLAFSTTWTLVLLEALMGLGAVSILVHPKTLESEKKRIEGMVGGLKCWVSGDVPPDLGQYPAYSKAFELSLTAPVTAVMTSGSSGSSKLAVHTLGQHVASARAVNKALGVTAASRVGLALPLSHVGGLAWVFRCREAGAVLSMDSDFRGITHLSWVPTQVHRALAQDDLSDLESAEAILVGGAALSADLLAKALNRGLPIVTTYGLTELASTVALGKASLKGTVLSHIELKLDQNGGLKLKGPSLFEGYFEQGQIIRDLSWEGFFEPGDVGQFESGALTILGRADDLIIRGGENIWPSEIEAGLLACPGILDAVVVGVKDIEYGQVLVAFIRSNFEWTESTLFADLSRFLPKHKWPSRILAWPDDTDKTTVLKEGPSSWMAFQQRL